MKSSMKLEAGLINKQEKRHSSNVDECLLLVLKLE